MSEHVFHVASNYSQRRPLSGAGAREYLAQGETSAGGVMSAQNAVNIDAGKTLDASKKDLAGNFVKGATFSWVDELKDPPPWLTEFKDLYQHLMTEGISHGVGMVAGRYFGRSGERVARRFSRRYFQKRFMKRGVKKWASAFHGR